MQYLISVIDDGQADLANATASATEAEQAAIDVFNDKLQAQGKWLFAGGLGGPDSATTIDNRGAETIITDGPFVETKEALGGYFLFEADDLDAAIEMAARVPAARLGGAVEIRPVQEW